MALPASPGPAAGGPGPAADELRAPASTEPALQACLREGLEPVAGWLKLASWRAASRRLTQPRRTGPRPRPRPSCWPRNWPAASRRHAFPQPLPLRLPIASKPWPRCSMPAAIRWRSSRRWRPRRSPACRRWHVPWRSNCSRPWSVSPRRHRCPCPCPPLRLREAARPAPVPPKGASCCRTPSPIPRTCVTR